MQLSCVHKCLMRMYTVRTHPRLLTKYLQMFPDPYWEGTSIIVRGGCFGENGKKSLVQEEQAGNGRGPVMQTIIYGRKLDESFRSVLFFFFLSFFCKKCPWSGCQSLRISPQHGICILDAMAMLLLWDQFIWRSGSCRCHWVLLSITKASVKLQSVRAHALFILLMGKKRFYKDRKTSVRQIGCIFRVADPLTV